MEIKGTEMDSIEKYLELSRTCPELFAQSEELPLVLDPKELYAFAQKSGRRIRHYHSRICLERSWTSHRIKTKRITRMAEESELYTRAITI